MYGDGTRCVRPRLGVLRPIEQIVKIWPKEPATIHSESIVERGNESGNYMFNTTDVMHKHEQSKHNQYLNIKG